MKSLLFVEDLPGSVESGRSFGTSELPFGAVPLADNSVLLPAGAELPIQFEEGIGIGEANENFERRLDIEFEARFEPGLGALHRSPLTI